jgi:hypothetical protein
LPISCGTSAGSISAEAESTVDVTCPAACDVRSIWGTDIYTDDSSICTAAAHAGVINLEAGGDLTITILDGQNSYSASERNNITSNDYGSWGRSFSVAPLPR